jgi:hypothetical protein
MTLKNCIFHGKRIEILEQTSLNKKSVLKKIVCKWPPNRCEASRCVFMEPCKEYITKFVKGVEAVFLHLELRCNVHQ